MTGQVDAVPAEPAEPSETLLGGRYRLGAPVGTGGMAVVHRGLDTRLQRVVAIKIFRAEEDGIGQRRFDEEAKLLASLEHPGLVTVFDAGRQGGSAYLVMQLVNGHTLREEIEHGPLPSDRVALLGARIADTLAHVHSRDVVHRDVKPSNILLDADGRPYLADFGISLLAGSARLTAATKLVGTAGYLAPEQVRGQCIGPATDVYALGLVLLECLTGRPEYAGGDVEVAVARLSRPPHVPASAPEELGRLLRAMTDNQPELRPDAAGCAEALAAMAGALPPAAGYGMTAPGLDMPTGPLGEVSVPRPARDVTRVWPADATRPAAVGQSRALLPRTRAGRATVAMLAVGLVVGGGAALLSGGRSPSTPPVANESVAPDTGQSNALSATGAPPPTGASAPSPVGNEHPAKPADAKHHGGHGKRGG